MVLTGSVIENIKIADNIFKTVLEFNEKLPKINCGQFLNISTGNSVNLLKRPFGIAEHTENTVTFCYQIKGGGTDSLSNANVGDKLECVLPLGNGFDIPKTAKNIALIGGGVGVFPLVSVINQHQDKNITAYFGYRNSDCVCFNNICVDKAVFSTDDGSYSQKGNSVESFIKDEDKNFDIILACGPAVMLKALKSSLATYEIKTKTLVSLEERMGCGIGACLVCAVKKTDGTIARVCKDGPVFDIWEVEL